MIWAYVLPFVTYLLGVTLIGSLPEESYPLGYAGVVAVCVAVLIWSLRESKAIKPHANVVLGVVVGVLGIVLWIGLSHLRLEDQISQWLPEALRPSPRVGYNPLEELAGWQAWAFVAIRLVGLAAVVPLAEELFWRGFLLRWLIDPDWEKVPIGKFTWASCLIVTVLFALAHPEWIAAVVYCLLINGLLYRTKDLWQCVVAHAVSNLLLGIYVLAFGQWWLW